MKEFYFFWNGKASQWYPSDFKFMGYEFNCAEQFMMSAKAKLFDDYQTFDKIMSTTNPKYQKSYGRMVKNFDSDKWDEYATDIVIIGNVMKFNSHSLWGWLSGIKKDYKYMVEASPYDKIWGIGLRENDPLCLNKETWQGQNLLGQCIDIAYLDIISLKNGKDEAGISYRLHKIKKLFGA